MINRDMHEVEAVGYADSLDSYGQPQTTPNRKRKIQMATYDYSHDNVNDVRMVDVVRIGLTKEDIVEGEHIIDNHKEYYAIKVMGNGRYKQVYMRLV